jgi:hypothetical protein
MSRSCYCRRCAERARRYRADRYRRLRAAGSCQDCGAEAVGKTTRCTPCGQRNAARRQAS